MKKALLVNFLVLFWAGTVGATTFYYEATDVVGTGSIEYGLGADIYDLALFSFIGTEGTVSTNLDTFIPGEYTINFYLEGLWADTRETGEADFFLPDVSLTDIGPINIPFLPPLVGTFGPLTWDFDPYSSLFLELDFGDTGNLDMNSLLAYLDPNSDGIMDAYIGWDTLRVELNSTAPVPEPSTFILLGAGIVGLAIYRRKKNS